MKVVLDISYLGCGHYLSSARTGIFRVVENLAWGLLSAPGCELVFCAADSLQRLNETLDYLESNTRFAAVSIPHPVLARKLYRAQLRFNHSLGSAVRFHGTHKALRRLLYLSNSGLGKFSKPIDSRILEGSNIFHSPYSPFPSQVDQLIGLQKFITVYDKFQLEILKTLAKDVWAVCISQSTKNDLCELLQFDPARAFVTHLAASPDLFYPCSDEEQIALVRQKYRIPPGPYLLSVNTQVPRKNIAHSLRCFTRLVKVERLTDLSFVLVGATGEYDGDLLKAIGESAREKARIVSTGYIADEDLAALYSGALAFVYPSFYEGFGLPPLEAMQCGVPVITSNTSSLPEVVGDAGVMLDPQDSDGLCQAMLDVYRDSAWRATLARKALEQSQKFSWERCVQETLAAYRIAVNS